MADPDRSSAGFDYSSAYFDRLLAAVVLCGFLVAAAVVGRISLPFLVVGALVTVVFEVISLRYRARVRSIWERPLVQLLVVGFGLGLAVFAWRFDLAAVIAAGIGATGAYLALSAFVSLGYLEV